MKRLTSYQRRLRNIEFYKQRGEQLEQIIEELVVQLKEAKLSPKLMLRGGIQGDQTLNDISSGDFAMRFV